MKNLFTTVENVLYNHFLVIATACYVLGMLAVVTGQNGFDLMVLVLGLSIFFVLSVTANVVVKIYDLLSGAVDYYVPTIKD